MDVELNNYLNSRNVYKGVMHTLNQFKGGLMTKKISKKDKLDAMLQMWNVLRAEHNSKRPWSSESSDHKLMTALQVELGIMLGITAEKVRTITGSKEGLLSRKDVEAVLSELDEVDVEITGQLLHADGEIYEGNSRLSSVRKYLRKKLEAVPVPADFDAEPEKYIEKPDEYKSEKDAEKKISEAREPEDSRQI